MKNLEYKIVSSIKMKMEESKENAEMMFPNAQEYFEGKRCAYQEILTIIDYYFLNYKNQ